MAEAIAPVTTPNTDAPGGEGTPEGDSPQQTGGRDPSARRDFVPPKTGSLLADKGEEPSKKVADPNKESTKAELQKMRLKLKLNGKEVEEEFDENRIKTAIQLETVSRQKLSEVAEERKRIESAIELLKTDPEAAYKALGIQDFDPRQHFAKKLADQYKEAIAEQNMTPEEKAKKEYEAKIAEHERRATEAEKKLQEREAREQYARTAEETRNTMLEALKSAGLPDTNENLMDLARLMRSNNRQGFEMTPAQLARAITDRREEGWKRIETDVLGENMSNEQVLKRVGVPFAKRVMAAYLESIRPKAKVAPSPTASTKQPKVEQPSISTSTAEGRNKTRNHFKFAMMGR